MTLIKQSFGDELHYENGILTILNMGPKQTISRESFQISAATIIDQLIRNELAHGDDRTLRALEEIKELATNAQQEIIKAYREKHKAFEDEFGDVIEQLS